MTPVALRTLLTCFRGVPLVILINGCAVSASIPSPSTNTLSLACTILKPTSVRVALSEYAPERLVLLGPGNTLGGICGQILAQLGWRGIRSRDDFQRVQESETPLVDSLQR